MNKDLLAKILKFFARKSSTGPGILKKLFQSATFFLKSKLSAKEIKMWIKWIIDEIPVS